MAGGDGETASVRPVPAGGADNSGSPRRRNRFARSIRPHQVSPFRRDRAENGEMAEVSAGGSNTTPGLRG